MAVTPGNPENCGHFIPVLITTAGVEQTKRRSNEGVGGRCFGGVVYADSCRCNSADIPGCSFPAAIDGQPGSLVCNQSNCRFFIMK